MWQTYEFELHQQLSKGSAGEAAEQSRGATGHREHEADGWQPEATGQCAVEIAQGQGRGVPHVEWLLHRAAAGLARQDSAREAHHHVGVVVDVNDRKTLLSVP